MNTFDDNKRVMMSGSDYVVPTTLRVESSNTWAPTMLCLTPSSSPSAPTPRPSVKWNSTR